MLLLENLKCHLRYSINGLKAGYFLPFEVSGKDIFAIGMFVVMDIFLVMRVFL